MHWEAVSVSLPLPLSLLLFILQSETCGGIQASGDSHGPGQKPPLAATRVHLVVLACHTRSVAKYGGGFSPSVKTFGSQPGSICTSLTVHQATLGSITGWDKVEATGSSVSDPRSLPFPPPRPESPRPYQGDLKGTWCQQATVRIMEKGTEPETLT